MGRIALWLTLGGLLAAACGGGGASEETVVSQEGVAPTTPFRVDRTPGRLIVIGDEPGTLALIEEFASLDLVEEIVVVGEGPCPTNPGVRCVSSGTGLGSPTTRQAIVLVDGLDGSDGFELYAADSAVVVVVADPGDSRLTDLVSSARPASVQVVPADVAGSTSAVQLALMIGANDDVAAFEALEVSPGAFVSVVHTVLDARMDPSSDDDTPEDVAVVTAPTPEVRWTADVSVVAGPIGLHNAGVVSRGVVAVLGNDGVARGFDAVTGSELWSNLIAPPPIMPATVAAVTANTLLMGTGPSQTAVDSPVTSTLWALDLHTGEALWSIETETSGAVGHPATDGERVYVWLAMTSDDEALRALDLSTGEEIWRLDGGLSRGPLRVQDGVVWTGSLDGVMRGVDAATGEEILRFETAAIGLGAIPSRPAVSGDLVMFGSDSGTFFAVDRRSGSEVWTFDADSPDLPSSPVVVGDVVVFGSFDGNVYGLEIATGEVRWTYSASIVLSSPAEAEGVVYFGSFGEPFAVHAVDARTGEVVWRLPVQVPVTASAVVDDQLVYIHTQDRIYAIER